MKSPDCPDLNTLEVLLLGKLPAAEREKLGEHLLHCDACAAAAETINTTDSLVEALRTSRPLERAGFRRRLRADIPGDPSPNPSADIGIRTGGRRPGRHIAGVLR
ncbi:anti-sigma factor [Lignipirellula cremea]|uniref:Zinc-finger domain-containing protein n=1 Tax=Lignipirellula cremea TaxID=2528010 RepID=A0A518E0N6_9BACT|nr:hypothetical protein [Lignipirellula cremea]QDU97640.1 hypothetical protein Pla8534_54910 [Lignipirellula cremea]